MPAPSQSRNAAFDTEDRITQAHDLLERSLYLGKVRSRNIGELLLIRSLEQIKQPANVDHRIGWRVLA